MKHSEFLKLTIPQRWSLFRVYMRDCTEPRLWGLNYIDWLDHYTCNYGDYVGVDWCGMFLGIERDGYTHS